MIIEHQQFDLFGKKILERAVFQAPLREPRALSEEACFLYSVKGRMQLYASAEKIDLSANEGVVMRCGNYLASHFRTDNKPSEAIAVHFYPEVLEKLYSEGLPSELLSPNDSAKERGQIVNVAIDNMIANYVGGLLSYFSNPKLITEELMTLKVKELIMLLIQTNDAQSEKIRSILAHLFVPNQSGLKEVVRAHLYENLTIQELSTLAGLSLSSFKRRFQDIYKETPATYFRQQRLQKASELLKQSNMQVKEICYKAGFNDVTSFTKLFTSHFGASPSRFREIELNQIAKH